jgi:hypothetical protein
VTLGGWVFMLASVAFVYGLTFWCFRKVLTTKPPGPAPEEHRRPR